MVRASVFAIAALCLVKLVFVDAKCPESDSLPDLVQVGVPDKCIEGTDGSKCHIFLRMAPNRVNSSFIDFYMEGNLTGWVAVGFSKDEKMVLTDVIGCKHAKDGTLGVINSWNPNVKPKHNVIDPSQDNMCSYSVKYEDKRLKCHFGRYSGIINEGYDYNLNGSYHLLLGTSDNQTPVDEAFPFHTVIPTPTKDTYDVYDHKQRSVKDSRN